MFKKTPYETHDADTTPAIQAEILECETVETADEDTVKKTKGVGQMVAGGAIAAAAAASKGAQAVAEAAGKAAPVIADAAGKAFPVVVDAALKGAQVAGKVGGNLLGKGLDALNQAAKKRADKHN